MKLELVDVKSEDSMDDIDDNSSSAPSSTYGQNRTPITVSQIFRCHKLLLFS